MLVRSLLRLKMSKNVGLSAVSGPSSILPCCGFCFSCLTVYKCLRGISAAGNGAFLLAARWGLLSGAEGRSHALPARP